MYKAPFLNCKAHAHPTWTYWALPFFGRWLRRHFRDERLPNVTLQGACSECGRGRTGKGCQVRRWLGNQ